MSITSADGWHGGWLPDELAALISLALGIRCRAGGETRAFRLDGDPKGEPVEFAHTPPYRPPLRRPPVLPRVLERHDLADLAGRLPLYVALDSSQARTLLRSARAYQEGIWIAEGDPEQAWLRLISSIETAADYWFHDDVSDVEVVEAARPELAKILIDVGGTDHLAQVAAELAPTMRATKKFLSFVEQFLPAPPDDRPDPAFQVDWSENAMKAATRKIYSYRSKSLHTASPFPGPMLEGPTRYAHDKPVAEKALGLGAAYGNHTWTAGDLPMLLHTFEHIVRGALLNWWESLAP
jgi:hypothetical protein